MLCRHLPNITPTPSPLLSLHGRRGLGGQVTPDLSEVTTPVQARPAALFQAAAPVKPSPPVGTPDVNLQQLVQKNVQEAMDGVHRKMDGVHRKMDAILQAMAQGPGAGGAGQFDAVVPPMRSLDPNVDPVVTYPLGGGGPLVLQVEMRSP